SGRAARRPRRPSRPRPAVARSSSPTGPPQPRTPWAPSPTAPWSGPRPPPAWPRCGRRTRPRSTRRYPDRRPSPLGPHVAGGSRRARERPARLSFPRPVLASFRGRGSPYAAEYLLDDLVGRPLAGLVRPDPPGQGGQGGVQAGLPVIGRHGADLGEFRNQTGV